MYVSLIKVLGEFNSLLLRWTIPFLLAQTSPQVLVAIWRCLGEGREHLSSKAAPLVPQKYTRDGGWPTDWNSIFCSFGSRKGNVVPKRKAKTPYKTTSEPPMHFLKRQGNAQTPPGPGSVQMYCPRSQDAGVEYPAWQRKTWSVNLYVSVSQHWSVYVQLWQQKSGKPTHISQLLHFYQGKKHAMLRRAPKAFMSSV